MLDGAAVVEGGGSVVVAGEGRGRIGEEGMRIALSRKAVFRRTVISESLCNEHISYMDQITQENVRTFQRPS